MRTRRPNPLVLPAVVLMCLLVAAATACAFPGESEDQELTLTVFTSSRSSEEVLLEWTGGPRGVRRWQYQFRRLSYDGPDPWTEWEDVPHRRTRVTRHRVGSLSHQLLGYEFRIRQTMDDITRSASAVGRPHAAGSDGIVYGAYGGPLEPGGTVRIASGSPYTVVVPSTRNWRMVGGPDGAGLADIATDSYHIINLRTGQEIARHISAPPALEQRLNELLDQIVASIRRVPLE